MFEKNYNISILLDFYGEILPKNQHDILYLYYNEDFSLAEIAENRGISRQGVRHNIKKGEDQLLFFENKLGLAKRFSDLKNTYNEIADILKATRDELLSDGRNPGLADKLDRAIALTKQSLQINI